MEISGASSALSRVSGCETLPTGMSPFSLSHQVEQPRYGALGGTVLTLCLVLHFLLGRGSLGCCLYFGKHFFFFFFPL